MAKDVLLHNDCNLRNLKKKVECCFAVKLVQMRVPEKRYHSITALYCSRDKSG